MIDGLGVAGWGVGGIEAEAVMLGQVHNLFNVVMLISSITSYSRMVQHVGGRCKSIYFGVCDLAIFGSVAVHVRMSLVLCI